MKKKIFPLCVALACLLAVGCGCEGFDHEGAEPMPFLFSVGAGQLVQFSQGNLQFCAVDSHATADGSSGGTFRFAEHQYDYLGTANAAVSDSNTGWIDLLTWGSSGWHVTPGSVVDGDYDIESLCGGEAYADWGVYNAISNGGDQPGQWRTLTHDEWDYLVNRRSASTVDGTDSARYAEATVCGTAGLVLFPDNFSRPSSIAPIVGINGNSFTISYSDNVYTADEWTLMETAGAVFLPAAGFRGGTWLSTIGEGGSYWASTCNADRQAYALLFINGLVNATAVSTYDHDRGYGRSVRLVKGWRQ
ncbi:MAG: hypothetical protein IJ524_07690 [Bacteroidales bacterium]|nr:hypothetical protein [Bacteroidales bacterium]